MLLVVKHYLENEALSVKVDVSLKTRAIQL